MLLESLSGTRTIGKSTDSTERIAMINDENNTEICGDYEKTAGELY
jgi:hypothetical protein